MNSKGRIVVADDELHILYVVAVKLREAGYTVLTARDGEELFELVQLERPDLLIADFQMPYLSGLEVCQRLRQIPATAHIPAVMLSASGYALDQRRLESVGIKACLQKPFSTGDLLVAVETVLAAAAA